MRVYEIWIVNDYGSIYMFIKLRQCAIIIIIIIIMQYFNQAWAWSRTKQ